MSSAMTEHSTPAANEAALLASFLSVRDPHERLALITDACAGPGIEASRRREEDLVPGCVSRVWLGGGASGGWMVLEWDAESPLVRGLAGLICRVYEQSSQHEVRGFSTSILTKLGLDRQLSPTRLRGLAAVECRIHELAAR